MIIIALSVAGLAVAAHDWYDSECCQSRDCRPAKQGEIVPFGPNWKVMPTDEIFPPMEERPVGGPPPLVPDRFHQFDPRHTYRSHDGVFHRCSVNGRNGSTTFCIYVPDPGS